jgi:large subunit ribosomal protein L28
LFNEHFATKAFYPSLLNPEKSGLCGLPLKGEEMAAYCQVTQTGPQFGHSVSHAQNKTKRRFDPNIQKKTYFVPSLKRNVTLTLSARGIKVIDARGIEAVVAELLARGEKI